MLFLVETRQKVDGYNEYIWLGFYNISITEKLTGCFTKINIFLQKQNSQCVKQFTQNEIYSLTDYDCLYENTP